MKTTNKKIISLFASAAMILSSGAVTPLATAADKLDVVSSYADTFHFEIKMDEAIKGSSISSVDKVTLKKSNGETVAISASDVSIYNDTFRFDVPIEADTQYSLSIGAGFGTDSTVLEENYDTAFVVKTLWDQKFEDSSVQLIGNLIRAYRTDDNASNNYLKIENGRLWSYDGMIAPIVSELATEKDVTFSYDFYPYSNANNNYYVGFNAQQLTYSATDMRFNLPAREMRAFGWKIVPPSKQGDQGSYQRFFNSGVFTIVDNPGEGYKIGDKYYWQNSSAGYNNVWVDNDNNRYITVEGVGKLDKVAYRGQHYLNLTNFGDASFDSATKTYTVKEEPAVTKMRVEKHDSVGTIVANGAVGDTYDSLVSGTPGYFGIYNAGGTASYDNMLITTYEEIETFNVTGAYADSFHIELETEDAIQGSAIQGIDKISLKKANGEAVEIKASDITISDNTFRINVALERDTQYSLSVDKGFGTETALLKSKYDVNFVVNTLWYQDFEDSSVQLIGNLIRAYRTEDSASNNHLKIENGRLWSYDGNIAPIVNELATEKDVTFSYDFYPYSNAANNYYIGFNSQQLTLSATDLKFNQQAKEMRTFGWKLYMPSGQDKTDGSYQRFFNSGVFTIVENPGAGYKIGDKYYWQNTSNGYKNVWVDSDGNRYYNVDGVGKLDAVAYRGQAGMNINGYGEGSYDTSTKKHTIAKEPAVTKISVEKHDSVGTLVSNGIVADKYDSLVSGTPGYFSIYNIGGTASYDNMLITNFKEIETFDAIGSYADTFHFELKTEDAIQGNAIQGIDKVSLKKANGDVVAIKASDVAVEGDAFRFNVPLEADVQYTITVDAGFGTTAEVLKSKYETNFVINTLWDQKFEDSSVQLIGNLIRAYRTEDSASNNYMKIEGGRLWSYDGTIAPIVNELATEKDVTFSYDFYPYSNAANNYYIGFNSQQLTYSATDMRFNQQAREMRSFGWKLYMPSGQDKPDGSYQRFFNSGVFTIVENPGEGYKVGDKYFWQNTSAGYKNVWVDSDGNRYYNVDGVGKLDAVAYRGQASMNINGYGDASFESSTKTYTVAKEPDVTKVRVEKHDSVGTLVSNGIVADTYDTLVSGTPGYFSLYNIAGIAAYDNMLITSYDNYDVVSSATLENASTSGVTLKTPVAFGEIKTYEGVTIKNMNTNKKVSIADVTSDGTTINVSAELDANVPYMVSVNAPFEGDKARFDGEAVDYFKLVKSGDVITMEKLETLPLNVVNLEADSNSIYVTFNQSVADATDFSKVEVTADGTNVNVACDVKGNLMTITPVSGMTSDAVYSITIMDGFKGSGIFETMSEYKNRFTVKIYANENFDGGKLSDASKVKVEGASYDFVDGGVVFRNATIGVDSLALANSENYTVKFDYKLYTASMNTAGKNYNSEVPNSLLWYNAPSFANSNAIEVSGWRMENDGVVRVVNKEEKEKAYFEEKATKFGDAYLEDDGKITLFEEGYNFVDNDYIFEDADGEIVMDSLRSPVLYEYTLNKAGKTANLYRDGALVDSCTGTETSGYFGLKAQETEFIWVDNFQAYSFEIVGNIVSKLDMENNNVVIENFDNSAVNAVIVVAAYDASNKMIDVCMPEVTSIQSGKVNVPFEFVTDSGAVCYKAFVWSDMTQLTPLCKPAVYYK